MERVVRKFTSFADADLADKLYYLSLTPMERVAITVELNRQWRRGDDGDAESEERLERVYRIVKLS